MENYTKVNWENGTTPLNASNLNHMDDQISLNTEAVIKLSTAVEEISVRYDRTSGTLIITPPNKGNL